MTPTRRRRGGFSLPELLVVIGVIALLLAILFPAASGVLRGGKMTASLSNLRQIATMTSTYATDHLDYVVPSQFDYSGAQFTFKGKVRSEPTNLGAMHQGTWTDILWTDAGLGNFPEPETSGQVGQSYHFDSPDSVLYDLLGEIPQDVFRSAAPNFRGVQAGTGPLPFGTGADERGERGYVAANDFFNARPDASGDPTGIGNWYTMGQIKAPERSMYAIDSFAGEIIEPIDAPWDIIAGTEQVDFRHNDSAIMLFMDGHTSVEGIWGTLADVEARRIRIRNLTTN